MTSLRLLPLLLFFGLSHLAAEEHPLAKGFQNPPTEARPETWFHLISGNVSKPGLTRDLEAVQSAGLSGIQLFHGRGRAWPGVTPQIPCLSPSWDSMISHVADETARLQLKFTMQNCPGWAMSGGPWITPDKAMRHLIWSRLDMKGGEKLSLSLPQPSPSEEDWRDYRDVAVIAFPTPADDSGKALVPATVSSSASDLPWAALLAGQDEVAIPLPASEGGTWVEVQFEEPTPLRTLELPPIEIFMARRNFDPSTRVRVQIPGEADGEWTDLTLREIPRGTWQDRRPEYPLFLAIADAPEGPLDRYRIVFENDYELNLTNFKLYSAARTNDWRAQAGYALRSLERMDPPAQNKAAFLDPKTVIDLSAMMSTEGQLEWEAPAGEWTVLRYGHVNTGVKNKPAPPEATGFECDKLSPLGAEQHFAGYIGRISAEGGPADQGRLQGMLIDSWECYTQTWTPRMETDFLERRNYALRPWLPALSGYVVQSHSQSERFLRDWRQTISDLLEDNYFGRLAELARERGMELSFESALGDVSPGDILRYYSKADIPMTEVWQPNDPHWGGLEAKPILPAVSAAHIYGKRRVAAEAFTKVGINWDEDPFMLKGFADRSFADGLNHLIFHTYTHNPLDKVPGSSFGGRIGTPFVRGQTWWHAMPAFTEYLSRCQTLLQAGQPVADVLYYLGDEVDHKPRQDEPFPVGYKCDYLNQDVLLNRLEVVDGQLQSPEGLTWKVLYLPKKRCEALTPETLYRLHALASDGAIILANPPKRNPSLKGGKDSDKVFRALRGELWGRAPGPEGDLAVAQGRLLWGLTLGEALEKLEIAPDVIGTSATLWCHRRTADTDLYFLSAPRDAALSANLTFRATGVPERWDPLTGTSTLIPFYHQSETQTVVPIELPATGSAFIIFRPGILPATAHRITRAGKTLLDTSDRARVETTEPMISTGITPEQEVQPYLASAMPPFQIVNDSEGQASFLGWEDGTYGLQKEDTTIAELTIKGTQSIPVKGAWRLTFPAGWGTPAMVELPKLKPWSMLENPASKAFSGTATYSRNINVGEVAPDRRYLLDLGRVSDLARVSVNGKKLPILWSAPFRCDLTGHLVDGDNFIEIEVTNTWHNRLIYEHSLPKKKRKTWTHAAPKAGTELEPAGLEGPMVLHIGKVLPLPSP